MATTTPQQAELFGFNPPACTDREVAGADMRSTLPVFVGCAGWSLASVVQRHFPATGTHLERYARILPSVEINSSFYRPHRAETYARWRDSVPDTFRFSVKMPKAITHQLRLQHIDAELVRFLDAAGHLHHKLGCLLVQLPPSLRFAPDTAEDFFRKLRTRVTIDIVCEPRHPSWAADEANVLFEQWGVARVLADPPVVTVSNQTCSSSVYMRLHGTPEIYHSSYSDDRLANLVKEIARHTEQGRRVWCVFDNTASGAAIPNALRLLQMLTHFSDGLSANLSASRCIPAYPFTSPASIFSV